LNEQKIYYCSSFSFSPSSNLFFFILDPYIRSSSSFISLNIFFFCCLLIQLQLYMLLLNFKQKKLFIQEKKMRFLGDEKEMKKALRKKRRGRAWISKRSFSNFLQPLLPLFLAFLKTILFL